MATDGELRLRHLADVHSIIARLSQNSFVIRGWSVTLVSLVFAIVSTRPQGTPALVLIALPPALIFWLLDAYYLRQERLFRGLYAAVGRSLAAGDDARIATSGEIATSGKLGAPGEIDTAGEILLFDMATDRFAGQVPSFVATLFASHVLAIPAMLTVLIVVYTLVAL